MTRPRDPAAVLTATDTVNDTMTLLSTHIPLPDSGYRCRQADLWRVVIAAAAQGTTIEATGADLPQVPHPNTSRGPLTTHWQPARMATLEAQVNTTLQATLPTWLWDGAYELAIDTHDVPYYGQHAARSRRLSL